jgi:arylsulfatase
MLNTLYTFRYPYELPRALSSGGYFTCSIGKDHFGWNTTTNEGVPHGYDRTDLYDGLQEELDDYDQWFAEANPGVNPMATGLEYNDYRGRAYVLDEYYHPTAYVGRAAIEFLKTYNQTRSFFLKVSFHRPHSPYDPPKVYMDQYDPTDMPDPYTGGNWDSRYAVHYNTTPDPGIWCGNISLDTLRVSRQAYYGNVGFIDSWVGEILTVLQEQGLADNTFVLFTADHGDMLGDHYHFRKTYPYFGSAHIPMMFKWPMSRRPHPPTGGDISEPRGSVREEVVELRDLFPTFLDVAGVPVAHTLNGSSLLNLLRASQPGHKLQNSISQQQQEGETWREYLDLEHSTCYNITNHWNALTDGHTKYVFRAYFDDEQLFDLDSDPHEMTNLAGEPEWRSTLEQWRGRMVEQFVREGRGPQWVVDRKLVRREKGQLYSPNYPGSTRNPPPIPDTD